MASFSADSTPIQASMDPSKVWIASVEAAPVPLGDGESSSVACRRCGSLNAYPLRALRLVYRNCCRCASALRSPWELDGFFPAVAEERRLHVVRARYFRFDDESAVIDCTETIRARVAGRGHASLVIGTCEDINLLCGGDPAIGVPKTLEITTEQFAHRVVTSFIVEQSLLREPVRLFAEDWDPEQLLRDGAGDAVGSAAVDPVFHDFRPSTAAATDAVWARSPGRPLGRSGSPGRTTTLSSGPSSSVSSLGSRAGSAVAGAPTPSSPFSSIVVVAASIGHPARPDRASIITEAIQRAIDSSPDGRKLELGLDEDLSTWLPDPCPGEEKLLVVRFALYQRDLEIRRRVLTPAQLPAHRADRIRERRRTSVFPGGRNLWSQVGGVAPEAMRDAFERPDLRRVSDAGAASEGRLGVVEGGSGGGGGGESAGSGGHRGGERSAGDLEADERAGGVGSSSSPSSSSSSSPSSSSSDPPLTGFFLEHEIFLAAPRENPSLYILAASWGHPFDSRGVYDVTMQVAARTLERRPWRQGRRPVRLRKRRPRASGTPGTGAAGGGASGTSGTSGASRGVGLPRATSPSPDGGASTTSGSVVGDEEVGAGERPGAVEDDWEEDSDDLDVGEEDERPWLRAGGGGDEDGDGGDDDDDDFYGATGLSRGASAVRFDLSAKHGGLGASFGTFGNFASASSASLTRGMSMGLMGSTDRSSAGAGAGAGAGSAGEGGVAELLEGEADGMYLHFRRNEDLHLLFGDPYRTLAKTLRVKYELKPQLRTVEVTVPNGRLHHELRLEGPVVAPTMVVMQALFTHASGKHAPVSVRSALRKRVEQLGGDRLIIDEFEDILALLGLNDAGFKPDHGGKGGTHSRSTSPSRARSTSRGRAIDAKESAPSAPTTVVDADPASPPPSAIDAKVRALPAASQKYFGTIEGSHRSRAAAGSASIARLGLGESVKQLRQVSQDGAEGAAIRRMLGIHAPASGGAGSILGRKKDEFHVLRIHLLTDGQRAEVVRYIRYGTNVLGAGQGVREMASRRGRDDGITIRRAEYGDPRDPRRRVDVRTKLERLVTETRDGTVLRMPKGTAVRDILGPNPAPELFPVRRWLHPAWRLRAFVVNICSLHLLSIAPVSPSCVLSFCRSPLAQILRVFYQPASLAGAVEIPGISPGMLGVDVRLGWAPLMERMRSERMRSKLVAWITSHTVRGTSEDR